MKTLPQTFLRMLCIVAVGSVCGVGATWRHWDQGDQPVQRTVFVPRVISVQDVEGALSSGGMIILDSRSRAEFEAGHVPGALALFEAPDRSLLAEVRRSVSRQAEVVLVGHQDRDFNALRLAQRVREWGIPRVRVMKGGMSAWQSAGLPIDKGWDMGPVMRMLGRDS